MKEYKAEFEYFEVSWLAISSIVLQKPWRLCLMVVGQHDAKMEVVDNGDNALIADDQGWASTRDPTALRLIDTSKSFHYTSRNFQVHSIIVSIFGI